MIIAINEHHFYDIWSMNVISRNVKLVLGYKQTTSQLHDFNMHTTKP